MLNCNEKGEKTMNDSPKHITYSEMSWEELEQEADRRLLKAAHALGYSELTVENLDEILVRIAEDSGHKIELSDPQLRQEFERLKEDLKDSRKG